MKHLLATTAVVVLLAGPTFAQSAVEPASDGAAPAAEQPEGGGMGWMVQPQAMGQGEFITSPEVNDLMATDLIGMRIYGSDTDYIAGEQVAADMQAGWDDIGEINDLLVTSDGKLRGVLIDVGGFLGMGEKTVAVDMSQLRFLTSADDLGETFITVSGTQESWENAPEFEADPMAGDALDSAAMNESSTAGVATGAAAVASMDNERYGSTMMDRPTAMHEGFAEVPVEEMTAESLEGARIYDANDEDIGEVANLLLDPAGQVTDAIVDVGGFLGIGERRVAIAFDEMQVMRSTDGDELRVYVNATKELLEERPEYDGS